MLSIIQYVRYFPLLMNLNLIFLSVDRLLVYYLIEMKVQQNVADSIFSNLGIAD